MKIVIPGGSGQVGIVLARAFEKDGHDVVILSRKPSSAPWRTVEWDGKTIGDWVNEIDGADLVINLAVDGVIGGSEPEAPDTWRFSIEVAKAWEKAALETGTPKTRKVLMRSAMTMSPDRGGIFDVMLGLVRLGLGGTAGSGKQFISWIHDRDFIRSVYWLIEHDELQGPINISSPSPLPNREFMSIFRKAWGTRIGLPGMEW